MAATDTPPPAQRAGFWTALRYKYLPTHMLGEVLAKSWIDTAIPAVLLAVVLAVFAVILPGFFSPASLSPLARVTGEYILLGIGQAVVIIGGGIDLSVGSMFALCNFFALWLMFTLKVPVLLAMVLTIVAGAALGAVNGVLIGYLRLRAFLTTLVTLIIFRSIANLISTNYGARLLGDYAVHGEDILTFMGDGDLFGLPASFIFAIGTSVLFYILLTRMRLGWHIIAVGGSRRSAFSAGINLRRTVFLTYAISGALAGAAAYFYAARLTSAGATTGLGMELIVITGVVLGGISLGGGRGTVTKAVLGILIVMCIYNGMLRMGLESGASSIMLGLILLAAVVFDIRWNKNRHKLLNRAYVSPALVEMPPRVSIERGSASPYARNDRIAETRPIGLGIVDGPEDMILDEDDNLYCGTRTGDVYRFFAPDYTRHEVFAHTGGRPLGFALDRDGSLVVCIAGMGLYRLTMDRQVIPLSTQTNRGLSVIDDSRVRLADDCDIAPDGKIYFSDPTTRYEVSEWLTVALENRGDGRVICYDPATGRSHTAIKGLTFPNGICVTRDGQAILVAETWSARIRKYWIAGPKKGQLEMLIEDLPGYPDNINRSSDGYYWAALVGMRSPAFDLALAMPAFRKKMVDRVAPDSWLYPNALMGCLVKFDADGRIIDVLWDRQGGDHPQITSVREHKGKMYLGGFHNDRVGVFDLPGADPGWSGWNDYWGQK
ncbi:ABC transporter permease [Ruixingdingia sedimenti]|uniref:SMP-30/gluconolactonase/LRE family protein n=1 Tax=Ruixingdingia sedimenti TaxID=3073604 RepID=A0ABU1FA40_9RHOB|nr:SMP-30/gluconolactonase/LRE family protein [Xinfangfangia sp. LG-4]MDR5653304.1 SMP-30/gluconolactonase/LRE family protein [Xinfangfangia sp. LG-4]